MELIVVTSPDKFRSELPVVRDLLAAGLDTLHLRKTKFSTSRLSEYLEEIPEKYHSRIVIHTHHKLVFRYALKGYHLTKHHRKNSAKLFFKRTLYRIRKPHLIVTRSYHQIETLKQDRMRYNYVFLNPFFSKIEPHKNSFDVNKDYLARLMAECKSPVFASGNISIENYPMLKGMNLRGMAISKLLWNFPGDKTALFEKIRSEVAGW